MGQYDEPYRENSANLAQLELCVTQRESVLSGPKKKSKNKTSYWILGVSLLADTTAVFLRDQKRGGLVSSCQAIDALTSAHSPCWHSLEEENSGEEAGLLTLTTHAHTRTHTLLWRSPSVGPRSCMAFSLPGVQGFCLLLYLSV